MAKAKKTRKFAAVKRMINPKDDRIKKNQEKAKEQLTQQKKGNNDVKDIPLASSSLFFNYNTALGPPYQVLVDTNFINFSIQHKMDIIKGMVDCLYGKCIPCVTDCVIGELEKMGHRYRLALRLAKDVRFKRLTCTHKGTYADDCIVQRCTEHKCYIVATNDRDLKRRIRKIPGVPLMYVTNHKYAIERMPDAITAVPASKVVPALKPKKKGRK
ncbi:unnamed protein product [Vitrella brassicaformis CCMP3155]|uniref:PIN domain-containing protein n=1 Tax=Vitrella brassicaformis (strain CCMP3155) TaxID=1169540 RepID=A0A0G4EAX1_VITBC|nr:unnamed protein product [Vitrella brassicaformis CCMP3155]|eukprot:CEL92598.1 unnamed protein product [Vitrella brassicaformis CCMP3155]